MSRLRDEIAALDVERGRLAAAAERAEAVVADENEDDGGAAVEFTRVTEGVKPYVVRMVCGHYEKRMMRPATAGAAWAGPRTVAALAGGRECARCAPESAPPGAQVAEYMEREPQRRGGSTRGTGRAVAMPDECGGCSATRGVPHPTVAGLYECAGCGGLGGRCYLGEFHGIVKSRWCDDPNVPRDRWRYYDVTTLGGGGKIDRHHGFYDRVTGCILQTG